MARIKIEDLKPLQELTDQELGSVVGGYALSGINMYDAWTPSAFKTSTAYDAWVPYAINQKTFGYDAWVP